jgi:hypothetical protein
MEGKINYSTVKSTWRYIDFSIEKSIHFFKICGLTKSIKSHIPHNLDLLIKDSINESLEEINNE